MSLNNSAFGKPYTFNFLNVRIFTNDTIDCHSKFGTGEFILALEIHYISYLKFYRFSLGIKYNFS